MKTPLLSLTLLLALLTLLPPNAFAQGGGDMPQSGSGQMETAKEPDPRETARAIRENILLFGEIYRQVTMRYVDHVNPEEFLRAGIDGMLSTLDPYTEYMVRDDSDELRIMSQGRYGGVGIRISTRGPNRVLTVVAPMEGTPAWRRGIRAGDQILYIDGESTEGFSTSDAADRMRGVPGTEVTLSIRRPGVEELLEYTITREEITVHDVSWAGILEPGVGYLRLTRFSRNSGEDVRAAVEEILAEAREDGTALEGMILDLRSNPGGLLQEAVNVAENFVAHGDPIVATRGRDSESEVQYRSEAQPALPLDVPLVVLINQGSASASEIVAGAVQDLDRGVLVGMGTFGKGLVQSAVNFRNNNILKLTTAKYYTPSGRLIQKIDYFTDNEALVNPYEEVVEDSLYQTAHGREVVARGGIQPDLEIEMPEVGELTLELWRKDLFYGFANRYRDEHPEGGEVDGEVYKRFREYVREQEFDFTSDLERHLQAIREGAEQASEDSSFYRELADLEAMVTAREEALYEQEQEEILERLRLEFASVYHGLSERTRVQAQMDLQVRKALEVLEEQDRYAELRLGLAETEAGVQ